MQKECLPPNLYCIVEVWLQYPWYTGVMNGALFSLHWFNCVCRRVYQCLNGLGRLVGPSKLGKDIIFGDLSRLKNSQGMSVQIY